MLFGVYYYIISTILISIALSLKNRDNIWYLGDDFTQERWLRHKENLHKTFTEGKWVNLISL